MTASREEITIALTSASAAELNNALAKIEHCLSQLNDDQLWWRPDASLNSVANLVLHLCGNLRQWIISGLGETPDRRNRAEEFSTRGPVAKDELVVKLRETVDEAKRTLMRLSPDDLLRKRRIQGFELDTVTAIFDSVPHFRGHTQEIVHLTRRQLGDGYEFDFVPSTPEQGA